MRTNVIAMVVILILATLGSLVGRTLPKTAVDYRSPPPKPVTALANYVPLTDTITVSGVSVGMSVESVRALPLKRKEVPEWKHTMWLSDGNVIVDFNDSRKVYSVTGNALFRDGHEILRAGCARSDALRALGPPKWADDDEKLWYYDVATTSHGKKALYVRFSPRYPFGAFALRSL